MQTDAPVSGLSFRLTFTGPIVKADFQYATAVRPGIVMSNLQGVFKEVAGDAFSFGFASPPFVPEQPIVVTVFSPTEVAVKGLQAEIQ